MNYLSFHAGTEGKMTKQNVKGLSKHTMRNDKKGFKNHTNEEIDSTNSKYNILGSKGGKDIKYLVEERLEKDFKGQRNLRKDAVVLREVIIQASSNIYEGMTIEEKREKTQEFINDSISWFAKEFGKDNIIGFCAHLDETNPHVHMMIMPMTKDGRISQKDFFKGPKDLKRQHREYREHMNSKGWDFEIENKRDNVDGLSLPKYKANAVKIEKMRDEQQKELEDISLSPEIQDMALQQVKADIYDNILFEENENLKEKEKKLLDFKKRVEAVRDKVRESQEKLKEREQQLIEKEKNIEIRISQDAVKLANNRDKAKRIIGNFSKKNHNLEFIDTFIDTANAGKGKQIKNKITGQLEPYTTRDAYYSTNKKFEENNKAMLNNIIINDEPDFDL